MSCTLSHEAIEKAKDFHGHWCPGLALGIRVAELALREVGRSSDEEVVALVECDMCGVDAIQSLVSCTFGKGNLLYRDYGKGVFSFWRRGDAKGIRISRKASSRPEDPRIGELNRKKREGALTSEEAALLQRDREEKCRSLMEAPLEELFIWELLEETPPPKAVIEPSYPCDCCGELVMASRLRSGEEGKSLCIPCFEKRDSE